jgi:exodeoxyribonuclease VII large subunit
MYPAAPEIKPLTLSELSQRIQGAIARYFGSDTYWVIAEISGHKFYPNNDRHYFDFIEKSEESHEPQAKIKGISWYQGSVSIRNFELQTGQQFTNGLQVLCRVKVEYHTTHGLSLIVQEVDVSFTLGNLEKQRRDTLLRLLNDNPEFIKLEGNEYITTNKKSLLPFVISDIAIIGSPNSEGYTDFVHTITSNQYGYTFRLFNFQTSVQGAGAETEIISTLIEIHQSGKKYDCVVIIRGGGARTDFLVFDTYRLARAAAKFPIPIITGIGHHKDISITDMMVHTSTKTPTKAAEFIISNNRVFEEEINILQNKLIIKSQQLIRSEAQNIHHLQLEINNEVRSLITIHKDDLHHFRSVAINQGRSVLFHHKNDLQNLRSSFVSNPLIIVKSKRSEVNAAGAILKMTVQKNISMQKEYLAHHHSLVTMMHPKNLLNKGFVVIKQNNKIIPGITGVAEDLPLTIVMHDGTIETGIQNINISNGQEPDL